MNQFFVVQVEDRRGDTIYVERLVTAWSIWGTRVLEEGSPVRAILQDLLPRLPPETDVDPRLTQYVATGALEPGS